MNPRNLQDCLEVLRNMAELELALASLYQSCSDAFPEDGGFWLAIKRQEQTHAEGIGRMAELLAANPQAFELGRPFNSVAIRNIKAHILEHAAGVARGDIPRAKALVIARDIENSVLEAKYAEFLKTSNVQFMGIMDTLAKETFAHKKSFAQRAAAGAA